MRPVEGLHGTAMVTRGGSVEADLAGGLADVEAGLPCTSGTRFQLRSIMGPTDTELDTNAVG